jgi:hypothetical protein
MYLSVGQYVALGRTNPPTLATAYMLSQIAHTRPKMSAAAEGRHAPCGGIIPMSASQSSHNFHNLELII